MIERKENIIQNFELAIFLLLVGMLLVTFTGKSDRLTHNTAQYEYVTGLQLNSASAILVDLAQIPSFHKITISFDKINLLSYNNYFKITADNRTTFRQIISLEYSIPYLQPLSICRFYYHLSSAITEDPLA